MLIWMREQKLIKVAETPLDRLNEDDTIISSTYKEGFFSPLAKKIPATVPADRQSAMVKWTNPVFAGKPASFGGITGYPNRGALQGLYNPAA